MTHLSARSLSKMAHIYKLRRDKLLQLIEAENRKAAMRRMSSISPMSSMVMAAPSTRCSKPASSPLDMSISTAATSTR
jgi:hypothetical protein